MYFFFLYQNMLFVTKRIFIYTIQICYNKILLKSNIFIFLKVKVEFLEKLLLLLLLLT